jgi:hypothetical protein
MSSGKASSQRRKRGVFVPEEINFRTVRMFSETLFQKEAHEQLLHQAKPWYPQVL